jgi:hypothetical protein
VVGGDGVTPDGEVEIDDGVNGDGHGTSGWELTLRDQRGFLIDRGMKVGLLLRGASFQCRFHSGPVVGGRRRRGPPEACGGMAIRR